MNVLSKKYPNTGMTTLNRMRDKNKNAAFVGGKERRSPFRNLRKEREENQRVSSPFKILISCLLSLRARDETTEEISKELFKKADTPKKIISIPNEKLKKIIFKTGHYNKKAQALKSVSKELIKKFDSKVPDNYEDLISIKHIGPKTAKIVLAFAFNKPVIPIDTHCHRIPNRLKWINTKTAEQTDKEIPKIIPKKYWSDFNAIFVQFGRDICQPVSPWCSKCPIEKYCPKEGVKKRR
jgi:endonuclease III